MHGVRHTVTSADGVPLATLTAGTGHPLMLVHGGLGSIRTWQPLWSRLTARWRVTAMDRRGREGSGDGPDYTLEREADDITAVATWLAGEYGEPSDLFAHSYGATCAITSAANRAPLHRIALYEPPGPTTVTHDWMERITALLENGRDGTAVLTFLTEIIGLSPVEVAGLRDSEASSNVLTIAAATMRREALAISQSDPSTAAATIHQPVLLLLGERSPGWAHETTSAIAAQLPASTIAILPRLGHEAITAAPHLVADQLEHFLAPS